MKEVFNRSASFCYPFQLHFMHILCRNMRSVLGKVNQFRSVTNTVFFLEFSKLILFDLGSSYFGGWKGDSTAAAGFWFYQYHRRFGIKFDRIIAFEHSLLDQKVAWEQLPDEVFPIYTLINVGISDNGTFNPWRMLRALTNENDYVIVKLDVDTPHLENSLINQVVDDKSIHTLIDELCFEHHTNVNEMIPFWGHVPSKLQDTYTLFTKIRQLGIRMHSWP
jgi:hypothetical protein